RRPTQAWLADSILADECAGYAMRGWRMEDGEWRMEDGVYPSSISTQHSALSTQHSLLILERRLRRRQPRDRHPIRPATDIVEASAMEELDRVGVAAMLAADTDLQIGPGATPPLSAHLHQLAHALLVDRDKRIFGKDAPGHIAGQKLACIVPRKTQRRLGQV